MENFVGLKPFLDNEGRFLNWHIFGDSALLRRSLYDQGFVDRTADGSEYSLIENIDEIDTYSIN